jgi:tripartite-type tricarboxylate transporter receptor subunit TctC
MVEFIAYAKKEGDKINLANAGLGAVSQLCGTLLQQALGVGFTAIPFSGTGPAMTALLGGQLDVLCDQTTQTLPQIKADKVKLYGVTTAERLSSLPDAPTLRESGLKDFEIVVWHGIYGPKGVPPEVVARFNLAIKEALKDPAVIQKINDLGAVIVPESKQNPAALQAWLSSEIAKWGPLLKAAGQYAD